MTTLRDIFTAFAPAYLERSPHLPTAHRQVLRAIGFQALGDVGEHRQEKHRKNCVGGNGGHRTGSYPRNSRVNRNDSSKNEVVDDTSWLPIPNRIGESLAKGNGFA